MVRRPPQLLVWICGLLLSGSLFGQAYNTADYVRNLYRKYLNREPTSNELTQWVWSLQKGLSLTEAQATFLSSDEYHRRYARDSSSFIAGLFHDVLDRPPSANESVRWLHSLNVAQGNRQKLVRDFLKATQEVALVVAPSPSRESVDQEDQLVVTAGLLLRAIDDELGGTPQGRQLAVTSRNLVNATHSLQKAKGVSPALRQQALADVREALTVVEQQMARLYFTAQTSSVYLDRCKQALDVLGSGAPATQPLPVVSRPAADAIGLELRNQYGQLSTALLNDIDQVVRLLRSAAAGDSYSSQLLRDVEFFQSQATSAHKKLDAAMLKQDLRNEFLRLRGLSQGVTRSLQRAGQVGRVVQRWEIVLQDLQEMGESLGIASGPAIDPGQPVLINLPTYYQLPYQVQRPSAAQLSSQAILLTDQAVAHIDAFIVGFNRFLPLSPRVPALQTQARALRILLLEFRQELASGTTAALSKARLAQINQSLLALRTLWTRTVQERQLTNVPDVAGISGAIESLNQIFPDS